MINDKPNFNELRHFDAIIAYLDSHKITYRLTWDKMGLSAFDYPKDFRASYTDVRLDSTYKTHHTSKFFYRLSWTIWNEKSMEIKEVSTQEEVIIFLKEIEKKYGNNTYSQQQLKLF